MNSEELLKLRPSYEQAQFHMERLLDYLEMYKNDRSFEVGVDLAHRLKTAIKS